MNAEGSIISNQSIFKRCVVPDVILSQDVIAFVATKLTLSSHKCHPLKLQICVLFRLELLDVRERPVEGPHKIVAYKFTVGIGIKPLTVFPEMSRGERFVHAVELEFRRTWVVPDNWAFLVLNARFRQLATQVGIVL